MKKVPKKGQTKYDFKDNSKTIISNICEFWTCDKSWLRPK